MSALQEAEEAVGKLTPEELVQFRAWLWQLDSPTKLTAQQRVEIQQARIDAGEVEPFAGVDMSRWPTGAQAKARQIINAWREEHGV